MSTGALNTSVRFEPRSGFRDESENGSTSFLDEGAILLENQAQAPDDEGQNMASPSAEPNDKMSDGTSIVDMVLVYEVPDPSSLDSEKEQQEEQDKNKIREFYIDGLKTAGLVVEVDQMTTTNAEVNNLGFIIVHYLTFVVIGNWNRVKYIHVCQVYRKAWILCYFCPRIFE
jgi:hypothetical protein